MDPEQLIAEIDNLHRNFEELEELELFISDNLAIIVDLAKDGLKYRNLHPTEIRDGQVWEVQAGGAKTSG
jgi:adenylosuccinate synthase